MYKRQSQDSCYDSWFRVQQNHVYFSGATGHETVSCEITFLSRSYIPDTGTYQPVIIREAAMLTIPGMAVFLYPPINNERTTTMAIKLLSLIHIYMCIRDRPGTERNSDLQQVGARYHHPPYQDGETRKGQGIQEVRKSFSHSVCLRYVADRL